VNSSLVELGTRLPTNGCDVDERLGAEPVGSVSPERGVDVFESRAWAPTWSLHVWIM
jgi:hypothetical protein